VPVINNIMQGSNRKTVTRFALETMLDLLSNEI